MIPKVLQALINNYNEYGIFFTTLDNKLLWFNGKRFEYWSKCCERMWAVKEIDNVIYGRKQCSAAAYKWNKNKFIKTQTIIEIQDTCDDQKNYYQLSGFFIEKNGKPIEHVSWSNVIKIIYYENYLYCFTNYSQNQKINLTTRIWSNFHNLPYTVWNINQIILFNGFFFALGNDRIYKYDMKDDIWIEIMFIE